MANFEVYKVENREIATYNFPAIGCYLEIVTNGDENTYEAWLYGQDMGTKEYIRSVSINDISFGGFLSKCCELIDDDFRDYQKAHS